MSNFTVTPEADSDLVATIEYIAAESPAAAVSVRNNIYEAFQKLGETPGSGHYREDLLDKRFRFQRVYSYLIVYKWERLPKSSRTSTTASTAGGSSKPQRRPPMSISWTAVLSRRSEGGGRRQRGLHQEHSSRRRCGAVGRLVRDR